MPEIMQLAMVMVSSLPSWLLPSTGAGMLLGGLAVCRRGRNPFLRALAAAVVLLGLFLLALSAIFLPLQVAGVGAGLLLGGLIVQRRSAHGFARNTAISAAVTGCTLLVLMAAVFAFGLFVYQHGSGVNPVFA